MAALDRIKKLYPALVSPRRGAALSVYLKQKKTLYIIKVDLI